MSIEETHDVSEWLMLLAVLRPEIKDEIRIEAGRLSWSIRSKELEAKRQWENAINKWLI